MNGNGDSKRYLTDTDYTEVLTLKELRRYKIAERAVILLSHFPEVITEKELEAGVQRAFNSRHTPYYHCLRYLMSAEEVGLLGYLINKKDYHQQRGECKKGWFYCTAAVILHDLGIHEKTQCRCFKSLKEKGIILQELRGIPRKRFFKINFRHLNKMMMAIEKKIREKPECILTE